MASSANPTIFFAIKMKNHWVDFYSFLINSIEMIVDSQNYPMSTNKVKEWSEKRYSVEHKTMRKTEKGKERGKKEELEVWEWTFLNVLTIKLLLAIYYMARFILL